MKVSLVHPGGHSLGLRVEKDEREDESEVDEDADAAADDGY